MRLHTQTSTLKKWPPGPQKFKKALIQNWGGAGDWALGEGLPDNRTMMSPKGKVAGWKQGIKGIETKLSKILSLVLKGDQYKSYDNTSSTDF